MIWEFPAIESLGDAVVVIGVEGVGTVGTVGTAGTDPAVPAGAPSMHLTYANRNAEKVFELESGLLPSAPTSGPPTGPGAGPGALSRLGELDRILEVAAGGQPDSWVSRHAGGWFELRAARLPSSATGQVQVLLVARDLGTVSTVPSEAAGATRVALLLEISRQLGAAVSEEQVASVYFDLVCPALGAESGTLAVVQPDGALTVLRRTATGSLSRAPATRPRDAALIAVARDAAPPGLAGRSVVTVPLRAGATTVGAIGLPLTGPEDLGRGRQEFIDTVAALVAQAVQRARLFDAQLEASLALQHALLPPVLPDVEGIELAARYRAGSGHEVGGDWYDVVPLASGWVAFVIGDVQGHDLSAAALMGQIRSVVRAYLLDELPPTAALSSANAFLLSLGVDRLVTVSVALVHPRSRLVTLASAGHPCPLLVVPGRLGELLEIPEGPPLGVQQDVIWRERTTPLPADATVVMYTDGLIERRNRPYADGERQLLELCARLPDVAPDPLADAVLALAGIEPPGRFGRAPEPGNEDDTALLLLQWRKTDPDAARLQAGEGGHVRTLPVTPASAVIARWYVEDLLRSWGVLEDSRETAVLLTDEIVANAVRHAHRTIRLDVTARDGDVLVEVFDDSHREPRLGDMEPDSTSGRGLVLVDALATTWGVRTSQGDLGKTVWFTIAHQG